MQPGHEEVALASKEEELLAELLDESSSFAQEMRVRLKRNIKKMMNICLTRFPISGLWVPYTYQNSGYFTRTVDFLGGCMTVNNLWKSLTGDDGADHEMSVSV